MQKPKSLVTGLRDELKQVTWPTRAETIQLTVTVITISLIVAVFVGIIDFSLAKVLEILSR
jgi:preprotein translocase subunit SecE